MTSKPPVIQSKNFKTRPLQDDPYKPTRHEISETSIEFDSDQLDSEPEAVKPKSRARRIVKFFFILILVAILGLGGFIVVRANGLLDNIFVGGNSSFYSRITDLISSQTGSKLIGEKENQINILLLGIGGPGHDGPYLSDTIILAQVKPEDNQATLTSIPRDYLVNTKQLGQRKINSVFAETFAETKDWEQSGEAIIAVVEEMSGLTIPYFAVIDFEGFEQTIDLIGGVDVTVERTFTDYTFPNSSGGYIPPVTFTQGPETMDGERALIFARSRHAAGVEGSDFARGQRQQKIIQAAKEKIVSLNLVADAGKINELFSIVGERFHTNMTPGELIRLYKIGKDYGSENISSLSLDPSTNLVCNDIIESTGAYVLRLCPGKSQQDLKDYFTQSFDTAKMAAEGATIWLADSTVTQLLYRPAETLLKNNGFTVYKVLYNGGNLGQNVVYAVNDKPSTIEFIKDRIDASEVSLAPPGIKVDPQKVDIIIILGE